MRTPRRLSSAICLFAMPRALASRDSERLAGHLGAIEHRVAVPALTLQVSTVNTLAQQLATVNTQLGGKISVAKQPAGLLDQRDQVLT